MTGQSAEVEAARERLTRFDEQHPEVVAEVKRRQREAVNRAFDHGL